MSEIITLDMDTPSVQYLCKKDKRLARVIEMVGPISYEPHEDDPFAFLIHEIVEQMLSVKAGRRIYERLEALCQGEITPNRIAALSLTDLRSTGTSNAKAEYIQIVANAVIEKTLVLEELPNLSDKEVMLRLTGLRGIGSWTAKMYLMFVLDRQNILPVEDGAFLQVFRWMYKTATCTEKEVMQKCKKWSPYSTIASRFCYRALDTGLTKKEFHLFKEI